MPEKTPEPAVYHAVPRQKPDWLKRQTKAKCRKIEKRKRAQQRRRHSVQASKYVDFADVDAIVREVEREELYGPDMISRTDAARILGVTPAKLDGWRVKEKGPPVYNAIVSDETLRICYKESEVREYARKLEKERKKAEKRRKSKKIAEKPAKPKAPPEILPPDPNMITARAAAEILGVSQCDFAQMVRKGEVPAGERVPMTVGGQPTLVTFYFRSDFS